MRTVACFAALVAFGSLTACHGVSNRSVGGNAGGGEATGGGGGAAGGSRNDGSAETGGGPAAPPAPLSCSEAQILTTGDGLFAIDTTSRADTQHPSCQPGTAGDAVVEFIAPVTDYYAFSTRRSSFDTVLALLDAACDGAELACNNDAGGLPQAELVQRLTAGQRTVVVVDGASGAEGSAVVDIQRVTCPAQDISGQPLPASFTTVGGKDAAASSCGGAGFPERTFRYTATRNGLYQFKATASSFNPVLTVSEGASCGGLVLGCNAASATSQFTDVTRYLNAGQSVTLTVGGRDGAGEFDLDAQRVADGCAPTAFPTDAVVQSVSAAHVVAGSCGGTGGFSGVGYRTFGEDRYAFPVNLGLGSLCSYTITADQPFNAYILRGTNCEGPETDCQSTTSGGAPYTTTFSFDFLDNGDYVLVIEGSGVGDMTYQIGAACVA